VTRPNKIACNDSLKKENKNLKKFTTILHYLTGKLTPYLTHSKIWANRPEAVGIKKRKSPQKRDDGRHFQIER